MAENYFKVLWKFQKSINWSKLDEICSPSFTLPKTHSSPTVELSIRLFQESGCYVLQRKEVNGDICVECEAITAGSSGSVQNTIIKSGKTDSDKVLMNSARNSVWPPDSVEFRFFGISKKIPFCYIYSTCHTAIFLNDYSLNASSIYLIFDTDREKLMLQPHSSSSTKLRVDVTGSNRSIWLYGKCILWELNDNNEIGYDRFYNVGSLRSQNSGEWHQIIALSPGNSALGGNLTLTFSTQSDVFRRNYGDYDTNQNLYKFEFVTALHDIISNSFTSCDVTIDNESSKFLSLLEQPLFSDFTLQVQEQKFPVHRSILAVQSPFFKAMFEAEMREKKNMCAELKDIDVETLQHLLRFFYGHVLEDLDVDSASRLYCAADQYQVVEVMRHCSSLLSAKLTVANACNILALAYAHQDDVLKGQAREFIFKNDKAIISTETWCSFKEHNKDIAFETLEFMYNKKL